MLERSGNPATRETSKDPIGFGGGVSNLYEYCLNDPLNNFDKNGLQFITYTEGQTIANTAKGWVGVPYYQGGGSRSSRQKADCSGAVWGIYNQAGYNTNYYDSRSFYRNPNFKPSPNNQPQPGDVGQWNGHVLIYDPTAVDQNGKKRNSWSAFRPTKDFDAADYNWWNKNGQSVNWYRYYKDDKNGKINCPK